jgi:hypothetical protein
MLEAAFAAFMALMAALLYGQGRQLRRQSDRLRGARPVTCAEAAQVAGSRPSPQVQGTAMGGAPSAAPATGVAAAPTVRCIGRTQPGPDGALTAPWSKRPCVWYEDVVIERYRGSETRSDGQGVSESPAVLERRVSTATSKAPFVLADESGHVVLDPAGARVETAMLVSSREERQPREGRIQGALGMERVEGYRRYEERVLRVDQRLVAVGAPVVRGEAVHLTAPRREQLLLVGGGDTDLGADDRRAAWWRFSFAAAAAAAGVGALFLGLLGG